MPTNEQRRETAKRKLERQLERRAAQARKRRILTIIGATVAAIAVIGAVVATVVITNRDSGDQTASAATTTTTATTSAAAEPAAPQSTPPAAGVRCTRRPGCRLPVPGVSGAGEQAGKPAADRQGADRPRAGQRQHGDQPGRYRVALDTGNSPCTVNSFASLAQQGYFNDTSCHRLTTTEGLAVLQCGDPTGQHRRPGLPVRQRIPDLPVPAGRSCAAAAGGVPARHAGDGQRRSRHQRQPVLPGVSGSELPPNYTAFGAVDETGLATLDKIAEAGVAGGQQDGKPNLDVMIKSIQLD